MKDLICIVVGLIALALAVWQFLAYMGQKPNEVSSIHLVFAVVGVVVAFACAVFFMLGRVNKQEEIHITK